MSVQDVGDCLLLPVNSSLADHTNDECGLAEENCLSMSACLHECYPEASHNASAIRVRNCISGGAHSNLCLGLERKIQACMSFPRDEVTFF